MGRLEDELEKELAEEKLADRGIGKNSRNSGKQEAGRGENGEPSPDALKKWFLWAGLAIVICLLVAAGGSMLSSSKNTVKAAVLEVASVSSVQMELNRKGKILRAIGLNEEGWDLLKNLKLNKMGLEKGVTDLFEAMARNGYPEKSGIIVMTVRASGEKNSVRLDRLMGEAALYAETALKKKQANTVLYTGAVSDVKEAEKLSSEYIIPFSHAYLVKDLIDKNTKLKLEDIGRLSRLEIGEVGREIEKNKYNTSLKKVTISSSYKQKEETAGTTEPETESAAETEPETQAQTESASESQEETKTDKKQRETAGETAQPPAETTPETAASAESSAPETTAAAQESSGAGEGVSAETPVSPAETASSPETTAPPAAETPAATEGPGGPGAEPPVNPLGPGYAPEETQPENYGPGAELTEAEGPSV